MLLLTACAVRRGPAPVSVALLRAEAPRRLTDRAALSPAAWAPDGRAVAYADGQGLWIHPLAGPERKVTGVGVATQVDWSPVTGLLAYIDRGQVMVVRPDGTERRTLAPPEAGAALFATHLAWAPGSDRLAVAVRTRRGPARSTVWLFSADGRFVREAYPGLDPGTAAPADHVVSGLAWFPDSLYLFLAVGPEGEAGATRLWRWRITYPDRRLLPAGFPHVFSPQPSPDGRWIAFITRAASPGGAQVWAIRADAGGAPRPLAGGGGRITSLAWAPTSDKVAYARVQDEAHGEIWLADVDGRGRLRVADFVAEFPDPTLPLVVRWSRDGTHLAYGSNSGSYTGPVWVVRLARR